MMQAQSETVIQWLLVRAERTPNQPAYSCRTEAGEWKSASWSEVRGRVQALSGHLIRIGLRSGDRVAIMLPTVPEWEYCHLAVLAFGGVVVGIDPHDAPENIRHVLHTVRPQALFLVSGEQLDHLKESLPIATEVVVVLESACPPTILSLNEFLTATADVDSSWPTVTPDHPATIVFTSGSTGQPKGIVYTHRQLCLAGEAILSRFPTIGEGDRFACWLPLSNLFQRIINLCAIVRGGESCFVESPREIMSWLSEIRPALFIGVPRFYEKLYDGIQAEIAKRSLLHQLALHFAWNVGEHFQKVQRENKRPGLLLRVAHAMAEHLVLRRLRDKLGLDLRFMVSGSAPLPVWLMEKLHGLGWLVLEAYGISECVVPIATGTHDNYRFGSVGRPLAENEIKLADDGEVLVRGKGVVTGYYGEGSIDTPLNADGYLHTGDSARLDEDGYLWLTGRKSEIFKTSTGHRIVPTPVEARLKQLAYVEYAVLLGRNRPVPVALLIIDANALPDSPQAAPLLPTLLQAIGRDITTACTPLPAYLRPAGVLVTRRGFSIADGELTSNLKLKRNVIENKYHAAIDALYCKLARSLERSPCLVLEVA